jgi:HNH endonuclease/AP2 domain
MSFSEILQSLKVEISSSHLPTRVTKSRDHKSSASGKLFKVLLTRGQVALVDEADFKRINKYKWRAHWDQQVRSFYAMRTTRDIKGNRLWISMHREVTCAPSGTYVDHKNHNSLDNRRDNLRICTNSQNQANRRLSWCNKSGFKGVSWCEPRAGWRAVLRINGRQKYLGIFETATKAALAYDGAAIDHFGDFALTNKKLGLIK